MGNGGEIFVFDMGKPVRIVDLAGADDPSERGEGNRDPVHGIARRGEVV